MSINSCMKQLRIGNVLWLEHALVLGAVPYCTLFHPHYHWEFSHVRTRRGLRPRPASDEGSLRPPPTIATPDKPSLRLNGRFRSVNNMRQVLCCSVCSLAELFPFSSWDVPPNLRLHPQVLDYAEYLYKSHCGEGGRSATKWFWMVTWGRCSINRERIPSSQLMLKRQVISEFVCANNVY